MKNPITKSPARLIPQLGSAVAGVTKYGLALGLPAGLGAALTAHETELLALHNAYQTAKTAAKNATTAKNNAVKSVRIFATKVRELNKPTVGYKYSQFWDAFGLSGSLRIPQPVEPLLVTLASMESHLTANPALGSEDAGLTGVQAGLLKTSLTNARTAATAKKSELQQANDDRMDKADVAQGALRELFSLLSFKLDPMDPRWLEFGFNKPGALPIPEVPTDVTAVVLAGNNIAVKWSGAARAIHYRPWMRLFGQSEWTALDSTSELTCLIENAPANAQVEVAVSAVNNGGESIRSTIVTVMTA